MSPRANPVPPPARVLRLAVAGADPLRSDDVLPVVVLTIAGTPPPVREVDGAWFEAQAFAVLQALAALPQGTRHRVLAGLLEEHATFYRGATVPPPVDPLDFAVPGVAVVRLQP